MNLSGKDINTIIARGVIALEKIGNELERQNNMNEKTLKENKRNKLNEFKKHLKSRNNVDFSLFEEIQEFLKDDETKEDK